LRHLDPGDVVDIIHAGNVARLQTRLVAETAISRSRPRPISGSPKYRGGTETEVPALIEERIRANTEAVLDEPRRSAMGYGSG
jgi:hypothetical protein